MRQANADPTNLTNNIFLYVIYCLTLPSLMRLVYEIKDRTYYSPFLHASCGLTQEISP